MIEAQMSVAVGVLEKQAGTAIRVEPAEAGQPLWSLFGHDGGTP